MPNHCSNILTVTTSNNTIEPIQKFYAENLETGNDKEDISFSHLSFGKNVPIPEEKKNDWYNWNCQNWGTKWDAYDVDIDDNNDIFTYYFNTAWSPPTSWLNEVASKYPNLDFTLEYSEPGCDFGGKMNFINGEITLDESYNLSEYNWEKVDKSLMEEVINEHLNSTDYDSETDMYEIAETIYENYSENTHH